MDTDNINRTHFLYSSRNSKETEKLEALVNLFLKTFKVYTRVPKNKDTRATAGFGYNEAEKSEEIIIEFENHITTLRRILNSGHTAQITNYEKPSLFDIVIDEDNYYRLRSKQ